MFVIDDSGSMDWEFMTTDGDDGLMWVGSDDYYYLYDSNDNLMQTSIWPVLGGGKKNTEDRKIWKSQWSGYNKMYYSPSYQYDPWVGEPDADPNTPKAHPMQAGATPNLDLNASYFSLSGVDVINAHYYVWSDSQGKPYLVVLDGAIKYYEVTTSGDKAVGLVEKTGSDIPADVESGRTYTEERQNFANWYSFYRKRWLASVAAMTRVLTDLRGVMLGWRTINGNSVQPVVPVKVPGMADQTANLIDALKRFRLVRNPAMTPLRDGLWKVGLYYHMNETTGSLEAALKDSPLSTAAGGECQQNFAIIFTDGSWNGGAAGFNNVDGDPNAVPWAGTAPYADNYPNTLADIAMYYYLSDLAPDVADEVPTNFYDKATWQHMVTYALTFGVNGQLNPNDYDLHNMDVSQRVYPVWPDPLGSDSAAKKAKIDDVWHAAVNGRGKYLSASNPQQLISYLNEVIKDIVSRIGSGASVSINGEELDTGTIVYQSLYSTDGWTGDVKAYPIDPSTGEVQRDNPLWSAEQKLLLKNWNDRVIATYDGTDGIPFRYDDSTAVRQSLFALLSGNPTTASNMVDYLRGDASLEVKNGGSLRDRYLRLPDDSTRDCKLGDIVHSSPVYQRYLRANGTSYGVIFVGANDGMLHAFDADTGEERFAYIPKLVFENLKELTRVDYSHRYYVNLTPVLNNVGTKALLVGGLGKGGKGYYALDMSDPESITSEAELAAKVEWEYPRPSTPQVEVDDMGYSFSRAFIVQSNDPAYPWVVIFGNGYHSPNGNAVLFILDAATGTLVKTIDTGIGPANGLATPAMIDANRDRKVDYVYAGDLKGNLWKFDLTDSNAHGLAGSPGWVSAFEQGNTPRALFQAKDNLGQTQPITVKPVVMAHPDPTMPGYIVIFGTGKYLGLSDFNDISTQSVYGVWDYGDDSDDGEYLGFFDRGATPQLSNQPNTVTLLEQTQIYYGQPYADGYYLRVLSDNAIRWEVQNDSKAGESPDPSATIANHAGWYFDLPIRKERMVKDMFLRVDKLIFISTIPSASACTAGGESILHEIKAATGGRLDTPQFDINNDDVIDDNDLITIIDPGTGSPIVVVPSGIWYPTVLYPPTIINAGQGKELKLMSTAGGAIIDIWETAEETGIFYWQQIQ
jgi:type IV pilus assembly protein PilY1